MCTRNPTFRPLSSILAFLILKNEIRWSTPHPSIIPWPRRPCDISPSNVCNAQYHPTHTRDPTGTGRGGESIYGGKFADEIHHDLKHTGAGILSMANAGKNTNGSQFFITLAGTPWLDGKHTIFGRVSSGMKTVQSMNQVETRETRPVTSMTHSLPFFCQLEDTDGVPRIP